MRAANATRRAIAGNLRRCAMVSCFEGASACRVIRFEEPGSPGTFVFGGNSPATGTHIFAEEIFLTEGQLSDRLVVRCVVLLVFSFPCDQRTQKGATAASCAAHAHGGVEKKAHSAIALRIQQLPF